MLFFHALFLYVLQVNKVLPYLVSNVVEMLDLDPLAGEDDGASVDTDASKTKCCVIKTSTRATYFLPVIGLVIFTCRCN
jgi:26S proteasome regulatory subunit T5